MLSYLIPIISMSSGEILVVGWPYVYMYVFFCVFLPVHSGHQVRWTYVSMYCHTYMHSKSMDQPGKVVNPARGQLNRENIYFPVRVRA